MRSRAEKIIEVSTWAILIVIIFGIRFLPNNTIQNSTTYYLIGGIVAFVLLYYLVIYKYFARSSRIYLKNIADIVLIGVLIHLLKDYGQYFFALYFLPIAAVALELEFVNALIIAAIASLFVVLEIFLSAQKLLPVENGLFQGIWQITLILFITIFCRMLAVQLKQERHAKEESLLRQKTLEEESVRQKEFLSMTSHQLYTPLSMIRGFTSMLQDKSLGNLNPKQERAVGEIYANTKRVIDLVSELLNISRIQANRFEIKKANTDLKELISQCISSFKETMNKKKLKFTFTVSGLESVNVDKDKIRQVITNLLDNAQKYTKKGQISLTCKQKEGKTTVKITDEGVGLREEDMGLLFQPFFRSQNVMEYDNKGTGLGLYISKIIIEKHGGRIWAEKNGGPGATFAFEIPND